MGEVAEGREVAGSGSIENGEESQCMGPIVSLETIIQSSSPRL